VRYGYDNTKTALQILSAKLPRRPRPQRERIISDRRYLRRCVRVLYHRCCDSWVVGMREIKVRVWDAGEKRMSPPFDLQYLGVGFPEVFIPIVFAATRTERFKWMQFTGLIDKNGKEIFESDIVIHPGKSVGGDSPRPAQIMFKEGGWMGYFPIGSAGTKWVERIDRDDYFEVIGNIWESPELLEAK
jgi:hypothetical protein